MENHLVADESVDFRIVIGLREVGFAGLLITEDKDFGELVFRLQLPHHGILLIRIEENVYKINSVVTTIKQHFLKLVDKFSVISNTKLRIKE